MATNSGRNPYLILGVPFGASPKQASRAFARRSRAARRGACPYTVDDLTWALHQVENLDRPELSIEHYRVPADPSALEIDAPLPLPPTRPLERRTSVDLDAALEQARERVVQELCWAVLEEARSAPGEVADWSRLRFG